MKNNQIEEVLFDLYLIDDNLKEYEEDLKDIIQDIYHSKPSVDFDDNYKKELRNQILLKIESYKRDNLNKRITLSDNLPKESNFLLIMKKINYFLTGVVSTLVIVLGVYFLTLNGNIKNPFIKDSTLKLSNTNLKNYSSKTNNGLSIKNVGNNAFGSIKEGMTIPANVKSAYNSGFKAVYESYEENTSVEDMSYIPTYYLFDYNFTDSLNELKYNSEGLDVLKKTPLTREKNTFNLSFNANGFDNLELGGISLIENKKDAYNVYYNFTEGELAINKIFDSTEDYYGSIKSIKEVPDNSELIKIANDFIKKIDLDMSNYGEPKVLDGFIKDYEKSEYKENFIFPDSVIVFYPLLINGKEVFKQYYNEQVGVNVAISLKKKIVVNVNNYSIQNYTASTYELEKDTNRLMRVIELGGDNNYYIDLSKEHNEVKIKINNMRLGYGQITTKDGNTLFVPAFIFDIEDSELADSLYNNKNLVVPIVKDFIDNIIK